jgi:hypothetical protein
MSVQVYLIAGEKSLNNFMRNMKERAEVENKSKLSGYGHA